MTTASPMISAADRASQAAGAVAADTGHDSGSASAEAFAGRVMAMYNDAALVLMTSIGHRTGLFDTLAEMPPATSGEIAAAAGLEERYVREWLGAMASGRIVEIDGATGRYRLPASHAASLTRAASPANLAAMAQYMAVLGGVEDRVVDCFRRGGGVPYSAYRRFHAVMAEDSSQTVVAALTDHILPLVPGLANRLDQGISVLDIGCGSGRAMTFLARSFPDSFFSGYDLSEEAISNARADAARLGLDNVSFKVLDAADLDEPESRDLITAFDAIHDQARPATVLANIAAALRPGGVFLMQDIAASSHVHGNLDHPLGPLLYTVSCMHCMTVSLAAGGAGLGAMWGEETARRMLGEAGFARIEVHRLPHDPQNSYYVCRKE